jgi:hypothetical protein
MTERTPAGKVKSGVDKIKKALQGRSETEVRYGQATENDEGQDGEVLKALRN